MTRKFFRVLALCCLATATSLGHLRSQTTIPFNSAQDYTGNFNEILDVGASTGPSNFMDYYAPAGAVRIIGDDVGSFHFASAGVSLYNPNASTTTTSPVFSTGTVAFDSSTIITQTSTQTIGVLARMQADGHGVYASYSPKFNAPATVSIAYGVFNALNPTIDGMIYSTTISFLPTHISLVQVPLPNGTPQFRLTLSDGSGNVLNSGLIALTQTTAYNNPGGVGFRLMDQFSTTPTVDNFFVSATVPEPGTTWLCGLAVGLGGFAVSRSSRRAKLHA